MRICQVVASLELQYGGPSRSVLHLSEGLSTSGDQVELLTTAPVSERTCTVGSLTIEVFQRGMPGFLCPSAGLRHRLENSGADIIHNHGLWLRPLAYSRKAAQARKIPLVISPRGMMGDWAWRHHRLRKQLCSLFVHPGAFAAVSGWHATSEDEEKDIRRLGFKQPICVAPNGVNEPDPADRPNALHVWRTLIPETASRPTALFYSRLHSKKRVKELILLWGQQAPPEWLLLVIGIPDEYSIPELTVFVSSLGLASRVRVDSGEGRPPPYAVASLFLLPSHNENFGLSIAEAMAHGIPVAVTDTTPWSGVVAAGCGWCVPWEKFGEALKHALDRSQSELQQMGQRGRQWVVNEFSWRKTSALLADFYRSIQIS